MKRAALLLLALASPALALDRAARYPAAQCAAFWLGRDDYARASPYLDRDTADLKLAQTSRDLAVALNGGNAAEVDAFITQERKVMAFMLDAFIFGGDAQSRDVHDRLLQTCNDLAQEPAP